MGNSSFLLAKILYRLPFLDRESIRFNNYRHTKINKALLPIFEEAYQQTKIQSFNRTDSKKKEIIWFFWWQGKESMPELVSKCYQSILSNSGRYRVQLITKSNINSYIKISDQIKRKLSEGTISLTHFSDIVRFKLLEEYGGLWLDATVYVTKSLETIDISNLFTCSGYPKNKDFNIAKGRWTGFCIGGPSRNLLFIFMNKFFETYWSKYSYQLDFFLIDYALNYAWEKDLSDFQTIIRKYQNFDPQMFNLLPILNKQFNDEIASQLVKDSFIFKLSNRKKITKNNKNFFTNLSKLQNK
ncbi:capsular polysaccharide synthesis protein [Limosilactobacillus urinaemulieris]|uniref:capsular polysaccharide synthesis protein n=1 Tax=Limosilactobacillus urinaemulieris TaxID=2742600 RepID=UPI001F5A4E3B|nr:capsular polysaccharide synthesis protein [Limosilactobacillus urinaemulieris]